MILKSGSGQVKLIASRKKLSTLSNPLELGIDNVPIEQAFSVKSLGTFDENLRLI